MPTIQTSRSEKRPLSGRTIAVPESRENELFVQLLQGQGATVVSCPLIAIIDPPDVDAARKWIARLSAGEFQDVIFMTGEGVRRLAALAEEAGQRDSFRRGLERTRKITRGPKPARALKELGLSIDLAAQTPTTDGIIASLSEDELSGRTIGVQLFAEDPNEKLMGYLKSKGAAPVPVVAYAYAPKADDQRCLALLEQMSRGEISVLAFTSASQVKRLIDVAVEHSKLPLLKQGMQKTSIAAIGPVVKDELDRNAVRVDILPLQPFVLKNFVRRICEHATNLK